MMNKLFTLCALAASLSIASGTQAKPVSPTDSLVIRFANRTRMVIYAPDKAGIQALSNYDLNKIVREMGMKLDSIPGGETAISRQNGDRYLKDTVLVVTKKKKGFTITFNSNGDTVRTERKTTTITIDEKGDTIRTETSETERTNRDYRRAKSKRGKRDKDFEFGISLGLNNFIQQSNTPSYPEDSYDLRPLGARYVALSAGSMPTLIGGKRASLKLYYGVEFAWNNFMFEGNNVAEKTPTGVAFPDAGRALQKTKLTVATVGIPVVPRVVFYNSDGRKTGHIGIGAYANYRLDSYRKIKEADGTKNREHSDFYLNNFRYGAIAQIGIRSLNLFVKYDLNPLFQSGKGPDVRTLTVGVGF